jgi:hypothetical protein
MTLTESVDHGAAAAHPTFFEHLAVEQVQNWCEVIGRFIRWQTEHILRGQPSSAVREDHRQGLKWFLRLTRLIYSVASDPDFPDKSLRSQLEAQMHQLETSWETFYNPMPEQEAERILAEAFPDGRFPPSRPGRGQRARGHL